MFLRKKGSAARAVPVARATQLSSLPALVQEKKLSCGDLVYCEGGYRGTTTLVVDAHQRLVPACDATYTCVPRAIAARIEDPGEFYRGVTDTHLTQGVTLIEFHPAAHRALLRDAGCPAGAPVVWTSYDGFYVVGDAPPRGSKRSA